MNSIFEMFQKATHGTPYVVTQEGDAVEISIDLENSYFWDQLKAAELTTWTKYRVAISEKSKRYSVTEITRRLEWEPGPDGREAPHVLGVFNPRGGVSARSGIEVRGGVIRRGGVTTRISSSDTLADDDRGPTWQPSPYSMDPGFPLRLIEHITAEMGLKEGLAGRTKVVLLGGIAAAVIAVAAVIFALMVGLG